MRDRGVMSFPLRRLVAYRVRSYNIRATRPKRQNPLPVGAHPVRDRGVMSLPLRRLVAYRVRSHKKTCVAHEVRGTNRSATEFMQ